MAPEVRQPWRAQTSLGWSHELARNTVMDIDFVDVRGHDLGVRFPLNARINNGARRYADLNLNPANPTMNMSVGSSTYQGVNFGVRRRMDHGIQLNVGAGSATRFFTGTLASHTVNTVFMKPTAFAGDAGQPEQRVGQLGFRFTF